MNRRCRTRRIVCAIASGTLALLTLSPGIAGAGLAVAHGDSSAMQVGVPRVPDPDETQPEPTEPETTAPETTEPTDTTPVEATPVDADSDDVNDAVAIASALAFVALVAAAAWWMVRRPDEDDPRHQPPSPDQPRPGQDLL